MKIDIKTLIIILLIAVIGIFVSLLIVGNNVLKEEARENDVLLPRNEFKEIFMERCVGDDETMTAYCNCGCDYLLDNYTTKEMSDAYDDTDKFDDMIWDVYEHCKYLAY